MRIICSVSSPSTGKRKSLNFLDFAKPSIFSVDSQISILMKKEDLMQFSKSVLSLDVLLVPAMIEDLNFKTFHCTCDASSLLLQIDVLWNLTLSKQIQDAWPMAFQNLCSFNC